MSKLNFTKTAFHNLFHKPATRMYPQQPRVYPQRTRGHIGIDIDTCIFCGMCMRKCPTGAISVDRAGKTWTIERFGCIQCGYCVESCPKKCLQMFQQYPEPSSQKYTESFSQPIPPKKEEPVEQAQPKSTGKEQA